jgi:hypothetical protein
MEAICSSETSVDTQHTTGRYIPEGGASILKMAAICSSETSVDSQQTTLRYIPEDRTFLNHRCENLRSYKAVGDRVSKITEESAAGLKVE